MFFGAGDRGKCMSTGRTPQEKAGIVLKFLNIGMSAVELHRKHNVSPTMLQNWKAKFMENIGRAHPPCFCWQLPPPRAFEDRLW